MWYRGSGTGQTPRSRRYHSGSPATLGICRTAVSRLLPVEAVRILTGSRLGCGRDQQEQGLTWLAAKRSSRRNFQVFQPADRLHFIGSHRADQLAISSCRAVCDTGIFTFDTTAYAGLQRPCLNNGCCRYCRCSGPGHCPDHLFPYPGNNAK